MAPFRIFYAWQSDRPNNLCRSLIRNALNDAKKQIQDSLAIEDASRVEVEIDQDTQGELGSPPVAETIFRKIRECDAFIADLTFTGCRDGKPGRPVPNPNVLIEYGYALSTLGENRIVAVFNEEFGSCEALPFDIKHRKWPIRYRTFGEDTDEQAQQARRSERKELAHKLASALGSLVQNAGKRERVADAVGEGPLVERFPLDATIYLLDAGTRHLFRDSGTKILLRVRSARGELSLKQVEVQRIAQTSLNPLAWRFLDGQSPARMDGGAASVKNPGTNGAEVEFASILLCDGGLYGIDCCHAGRQPNALVADPFLLVKDVEKILEDGLCNFLEVAKGDLDLELPLDVEVALEGVKDHVVVVERGSNIPDLRGWLLAKRIEDRFKVKDYAQDPVSLLRPFIGKIYDGAGLEQP